MGLFAKLMGAFSHFADSHPKVKLAAEIVGPVASHLAAGGTHLDVASVLRDLATQIEEHAAEIGAAVGATTASGE